MNAVVERNNVEQLPVATGPLDRIADLMVRGITPDQLDKYLDVQQKYEAEQARRAYVKAMAAFKAEPIEPIKKKKTVRIRLKPRDGQTQGGEMTYKQETLAQVVRVATPKLAQHGLSHAWTVTADKATRVITVRCVMTHELGHSEFVELPGMPDDSGHKNPLQQMRSTITYLQRATLLLITGLAAEDGSDDDGGRPRQDDEPPEQRASGKATAKQIALIRKKAKSDEALADALAEIGVNTTEQIPFDRVNDVLAALEK